MEREFGAEVGDERVTGLGLSWKPVEPGFGVQVIGEVTFGVLKRGGEGCVSGCVEVRESAELPEWRVIAGVPGSGIDGGEEALR